MIIGGDICHDHNIRLLALAAKTWLMMGKTENGTKL